MNTDTLIDDASRPTRAVTLGGLERWGSVTTAAALMLYGVSAGARRPESDSRSPRRRSRIAGWPADGRQRWTPRLHRDARETRARSPAMAGSVVHESVRLERPVAEVYSFWRRFENLPRFMDHLHEVIDTGDGRSHWSRQRAQAACWSSGMPRSSTKSRTR